MVSLVGTVRVVQRFAYGGYSTQVAGAASWGGICLREGRDDDGRHRGDLNVYETRIMGG